jgi:hypothetical protein
MGKNKNISKSENNLIDEILKKNTLGEIFEELSNTPGFAINSQGKPTKNAFGTSAPRKSFLDCFQWQHVKNSYLFSGKAFIALLYFVLVMFLVNSDTFQDLPFYDLGIRLYLTSVTFQWITHFPGFLVSEAAIFTIWPLSLSVLSAMMKDKKNVNFRYCICDIVYMVVVISILSLAVLFVNVDRNKKACYMETYNYYCKRHNATNIEIPGVKIDISKACQEGQDACDFSGVYENEGYRLQVKICRETVDAGLLSADFVAANSRLFENLLETKWRMINSAYGAKQTRMFKEQVNRYQEFISGGPGEPELKEYIEHLDTDIGVEDILVLLYYLESKWRKPGLVLKERMLRIINSNEQ